MQIPSSHSLSEPTEGPVVPRSIDPLLKDLSQGTDLASITSQWRGNNNEEKNSHGLAFPNLPYWIDDDVKLTQSLTILK